MQISVIIPTIHREKDLKVLFASFLEQTKKVLEIIVVDQSNNDETRELCGEFDGLLPIRYFYFHEKSGSRSRNFGIKQAHGDVIAFLDDDTKLLPHYFEQVEKFYEEYPQAIGAMGRIINFMESREKVAGKGLLYSLYKFFAVIFALNTYKKGFTMLASGRNIDGYESEQAMGAQWLSTCNSWYKAEIFKEFSFEERFEKWSFGEDRMLSYQISSAHPGSLYFYPKAALYHYESSANRLPEQNKVSMKVVYQFWFFHKCMGKNYFFYWWGNVGEVLLHILNACVLREPFLNSLYYIRANLALIKNYKTIKEGNLKVVVN